MQKRSLVKFNNVDKYISGSELSKIKKIILKTNLCKMYLCNL